MQRDVENTHVPVTSSAPVAAMAPVGTAPNPSAQPPATQMFTPAAPATAPVAAAAPLGTAPGLNAHPPATQMFTPAAPASAPVAAAAPLGAAPNSSAQPPAKPMFTPAAPATPPVASAAPVGTAPGLSAQPPAARLFTPAAPAPATALVTRSELLPGPSALVSATGPLSEDALMGQQLTDQYDRACCAMSEVIKFGAMMLRIRETVFARGHCSGWGKVGDGLKAWLERYAPQINRSTAYRFMNVAEAVAAEFSLPKEVKFSELAITPTLELPENLREKQRELWAFVNGTSQRSWLDRLALTKPKKAPEQKTLAPDQRPEPRKKRSPDELDGLMDGVEKFAKEKLYQVWDDDDLDRAILILGRARDGVQAWRSLPKADRVLTGTQANLATGKGAK